MAVVVIECSYCEGWGCRCLGYGTIVYGLKHLDQDLVDKPNERCWCPATNVCPECKGTGRS